MAVLIVSHETEMAKSPIQLRLFTILQFLLLLGPSDAMQFTTQRQLPPLPKWGTQKAIEQQEMEQVLPLSPSDIAALQAIKNSLHDLPGSDFFSTWDFNSPSNPCSSFAGISCSITFESIPSAPPALLRVTSLALGTGLADSPGLTGVFPDSISNLTALTQFILFAGRVSGTIPSNIGDKLTSLTFLSVTNNLISGPIPTSLSNLPDLHTLDLGHNRLSGQIPPSLCSLPNLKVLILSSNGYLSGEVPNVLSPLLHLDLRSNSFTGQLPLLPITLRYLSASSNYMSGSLDNVAGLPNLAFLDLGMNAFNGPIPASLFSPSVPLLLLQRNYLSGGLPNTIAVRSAASPGGNSDDDGGFDVSGWTVDLSHNMLTGKVTAVLAGAESVYLNNNRFVGAVPSEYSRSVFAGTMKTFYAQHNFLTGFDFPLPPGSATLPSSVALCLVYNCMNPPPVGPTVCPSSAGDAIARPTTQCPVFSSAP